MREIIECIIENIDDIVIALLVAIVAAALPFIVTHFIEKRKDRISPIVSVLDDSINDVHNRLEKGEFGCFFDIKDLKQYENSDYFYFIIRIDSNNLVSDCEITFKRDEKNMLGVYKIGNLNHRQKLLFPIKKEKHGEIIVIVKYKTSHNENLHYKTTIYVEENKITGKRKEVFSKLKVRKQKNNMANKNKKEKNTGKLIRENEFTITENYNSNEVYARLTEKNISLNKIRIYDKEKNDENK